MIKCHTCKSLRPLPEEVCPTCGSDELSPSDISFMLTVASRAMKERKYSEATDIYRRLAARGESEARREYGKMLIEGRLLPRDREGGVRLLLSAAEDGDAEALFRVSRLSPEGKRSRLLLLLSAALGYNGAHADAASIYEEEGNRDAARLCLTLGALGEDSAAALRLAELTAKEGEPGLAAWALRRAEEHRRGLRRGARRTLRRRLKKAEPQEPEVDHRVERKMLFRLREEVEAAGFRRGYFLLTERLAELGTGGEALRLGRLYLFGDGCGRSVERARALFGSDPSADAAEELARISEAEGSTDAAAELYIRAAELGNTACFGKAADLMRRSAPARALELYSRGARAADVYCRECEEQLLREREALFCLGESCAATDRERAEAAYRRSIELGYVPALRALAALYEEAGGSEGRRRAFLLYQEAKTKGDDRAIADLGRCYLHGIGIAQNRRAAERYLAMASRIGNEVARAELGELNERRKRALAQRLLSSGIRHIHARRFVEAKEALTRSADLGSPSAHYALGCLAEFGRGGVANREQARAHYSAARSAGFRDPDGSYKRRILAMSR